MSNFTDDLGRTWVVDDFVSGGLYATDTNGLEYQWWSNEDLIAMNIDPTKLMQADMTTEPANSDLDEIFDKYTVALTRYTEEQTANPDLSSLLEITDYDTRVINIHEAKQAILANYVSKEELRAAIDNLNNPGEYEDWGTYGEGFAACQAELRKQLLEEGK